MQLNFKQMDSVSFNETLSDHWKLNSISTIKYLQDSLLPYEKWIVQASHVGDNREAFTFYFPLIAGFSNLFGAQMLWAAILVEWSNLILKWCFKGDRPFWWVAETPIFNNTTRPLLKQFPNTCESGPGTPSGHVMMNVAIFYIFLAGFLRSYIWNSQISGFLKRFLSLLLFIPYIAWISIIFISRLYIQAHFIHQCLLGTLLGLLLGHIAWTSKGLVQTTRLKSILASGFLCGSSLVVYFGFLEYGMDPLWAIPKALQYCSNPEHVKVDTQPFFIMVRFTSASLGTGYALCSTRRQEALRAPHSYVRVLLAVKAGMLVGRLGTIMQTNLPMDELQLYLSGCSLIHLCVPYIVLAVVPSFILSVYPPSYK